MDAETVKLAAMKVEIPISELVEPFVSGPMTVFIGSMPATGIDDRDKCGAELRSEELPRPPERSRTGPPKTARGKSGGQRAVKSILGKDDAGLGFSEAGFDVGIDVDTSSKPHGWYLTQMRALQKPKQCDRAPRDVSTPRGLIVSSKPQPASS